MSGLAVAIVATFLSGEPTDVQIIGGAPSLAECQSSLDKVIKKSLPGLPPGVTIKYKCVSMDDAEDTGKVKT